MFIIKEQLSVSVDVRKKKEEGGDVPFDHMGFLSDDGFHGNDVVWILDIFPSIHQSWEMAKEGWTDGIKVFYRFDDFTIIVRDQEHP